ncbi:M43 family zinc metalloprotease [uncultured Rikenella sp.]|uniref:M43 family zinc metalloprotease n=1 Tax=uncultured Rikenella sp. TaxID=368003 RepID=UPI0026305495|nr:M43 family zinc metalloprotease [uncultured Rikenella sp.]
MKTKILLSLTAFALLLAGCKKDTAPQEPASSDIPNGTIPIVFHVLYENPADPIQNPDASVFRKRIGQINEFYAATLFPNAGSRKVQVTFTLATHDPTGRLLDEPGVNRVGYAGSANMSASEFLSAKRTLQARDKAILWDPNRYVNVWLFGFLVSSDPEQDENNVTGISYLPYCTTAHPLDLLVKWDGAITQQPYYMHGITLNNRYFLPHTSGGNLLDDEGMFTFCHEMGHYLGLRHAFSEPKEGEGDCDNPDNASDDGCSDTPKYDRKTYQASFYAGTLPYDRYYRQPCDGGELCLSTNVMDYYYSLRTNLTAQQQARIEHVMAYSPWIPRSKAATKALLENFTGEITDERPEPILMY